MTTAIKICGVCDPEIAKAAVKAGAVYIGIMMYAGSKRYVDLEVAAKISQAVKSAGGMPVAVFVDATAEQMKAACEATGVETVQLHGTISRSDHQQLPDHYRRIYVLHVNADGVCLDDTDGGLADLKADRDLLLYDGVEGGSGRAFSLQSFKNRYDYSFLLAGGLRPETVAEAIKIVQPFGVDVSSGVEKSPGVKDIGLIKKFIVAASTGCIANEYKNEHKK